MTTEYNTKLFCKAKWQLHHNWAATAFWLCAADYHTDPDLSQAIYFHIVKYEDVIGDNYD